MAKLPPLHLDLLGVRTLSSKELREMKELASILIDFLPEGFLLAELDEPLIGNLFDKWQGLYYRYERRGATDP